jgi:hypothetical protein
MGIRNVGDMILDGIADFSEIITIARGILIYFF